MDNALRVFDRLPDLDSEEATAARLRVGWRLVRTAAIMQGRIQPDAPLEMALHDSEEPRMMLRHAAIPRGALTHAAVSLVPPTTLPQFEYWEALSRFIAADVMHETDPMTSADTLWGMLDPRTAQQYFPELMELCTYERQITEIVLRKALRSTPLDLHRWVRSNLLLTDNETTSLISISRKEARKLVSMDQEDERAMMTLRLNDVQKRARRSFNVREEMNALKMEAQVRGLTASKPEGLLDVFARVVARQDENSPTLELDEGDDTN